METNFKEISPTDPNRYANALDKCCKTYTYISLSGGGSTGRRLRTDYWCTIQHAFRGGDGVVRVTDFQTPLSTSS